LQLYGDKGESDGMGVSILVFLDPFATNIGRDVDGKQAGVSILVF